MSFVRIIEEKNPIELHNQVYEASKNNALTPGVCMEVLSHTNVPVIMGKMLEKIEKLPIDEQGQYNEVILSMFDYRQTSEKVRDKALVVAKNNGFVSELNDVIERTGEGGYSARNGVKDEMYVIDKAGDYSEVDFSSYKGVIVKGEIKEEIKLNTNNSLKGVLDLRGGKNIDLSDCDLSKVTKIIFEEGAEIDIQSTYNLPTDLDVSMCDEVNLSWCDLSKINLKFREGAEVHLWGAKNLPKDLDVSMCDSVNLDECNLEGIKLKFREGSTVYLNEATNLPKDLDVSMCDSVNLDECNLEGINLKFRKGAVVGLSGATNLPTNLDVSMCKKIFLGDCDLEGINLKFREGAEVHLWGANNLPHNLDVSMCDSVNLDECNLEGINLKFRKGAVVGLCGAKNLPTNLDVSMCKFVTMNDADISKVKELKFKNEEQMMKSQVKIPEGWGGKVIYTDDEKQMPVISRENDGR